MSSLRGLLDCVAGALIGAISALGALAFDSYLEQMLQWRGSLGMCNELICLVPLSIFALGCLSLVIQPIPLEPCPCYDDGMRIFILI